MKTDETMWKWLAAAVLLTLASACVTINIYFPAAAAEKAADKIIDKVLASDKAPSVQGTPPATNKPK